MKNLVAVVVLASLVGCSSGLEEQTDQFTDINFDLCQTETKVYSQSDDDVIRIACKDGGYFMLSEYKDLEVMRELNGAFCMGTGLHRFNSSDRYYTFICKSGEKFSIKK